MAEEGAETLLVLVTMGEEVVQLFAEGMKISSLRGEEEEDIVKIIKGGQRPLLALASYKQFLSKDVSIIYVQ